MVLLANKSKQNYSRRKIQQITLFQKIKLICLLENMGKVSQTQKIKIGENRMFDLKSRYLLLHRFLNRVV